MYRQMTTAYWVQTSEAIGRHQDLAAGERHGICQMGERALRFVKRVALIVEMEEVRYGSLRLHLSCRSPNLGSNARSSGCVTALRSSRPLLLWRVNDGR